MICPLNLPFKKRPRCGWYNESTENNGSRLCWFNGWSTACHSKMIPSNPSSALFDVLMEIKNLFNKSSIILEKKINKNETGLPKKHARDVVELIVVIFFSQSKLFKSVKAYVCIYLFILDVHNLQAFRSYLVQINWTSNKANKEVGGPCWTMTCSISAYKP